MNSKIQQKGRHNISIYLPPPFIAVLQESADALGYPTVTSYIQRLLIEGHKKKYKYEDPYEGIFPATKIGAEKVAMK